MCICPAAILLDIKTWGGLGQTHPSKSPKHKDRVFTQKTKQNVAQHQKSSVKMIFLSPVGVQSASKSITQWDSKDHKKIKKHPKIATQHLPRAEYMTRECLVLHTCYVLVTSLN
jgi:hypothetical protein